MQSPGEKGEQETGRIELHGEGLGAPTEEEVEERAQEIARLDDRTPEQVTESDRSQALREIRHQGSPVTENEAEGDMMASTDPSEPPADTGHQAPETAEPDEQRIVEEEVEEGIAEADHDSRLNAHESEEEENRL